MKAWIQRDPVVYFKVEGNANTLRESTLDKVENVS
jgi:hypothetical protein